MQVNAMLLLCAVAPVAAMLRGTGDQTLMTNMQPEVVRKLLNSVEDKWVHTRAMVLSNATDDTEAFSDMEKSCVKVSSAIVAGSEGQKDRVSEYMQDVCTADGAHDEKGLCAGFASGIQAVMTDDPEFNRDGLQMSQFCKKFWEKDVTNAAQAEAKKRADEAEKERKEQEEAAKKAAAEEAAAKKAAAEEAAAQEKARLKAEAEQAAKEKEAAEEAARQAAEAAEAAKAQTNETSAAVPAQTNETSVAQVNATATPVESAQANSTVTQPSSNVEQTNVGSAAPATQDNSSADATPAVVAEASDKNTDSTPVAKTSLAVKNATVKKNATVESATVKNATVKNAPVQNATVKNATVAVKK